MSPLAPAGARGYPPWQRILNYDEGVYASWNGQAVGAGIITPWHDVSRFSNLSGQLFVASGLAEVQITWAIDAAGSAFLGTRRWWVDSNITGTPFSIPNLGPYVQVSVFQVGGNTGQALTGHLFGSNREYPLIFQPKDPTLMTELGVGINAVSSDTFYPGDYHAGPMQVVVEGSQNWQLSLAALDSSGGYRTVFASNVFAGGTWQTFNLLAPFSAWTLGLENTAGAAGTFTLIATPSATGSS